MSEELRMLPGPYEILDLKDGESITLRIVGWERGKIIIHPRYPGAPPEKEIPVLRVHVTEDTKPYPPYYYDITAKTLQYQLLPYLLEPGYEKYLFKITKHGVPPRARFTLIRIPP